MVIQIAKAELRNLFYSPVAWFLAIAFLVLCGYFYTATMYPIAKGQDIAAELFPGKNMLELFPLTLLFYLAPGGIFQVALQNLYLFIPLLTMGMISREVNNGTIKLLYSSPVKLRHLIIGKYLALMIYNLVLVCILGIFMVNGLFHFRNPDYGLLISAALGFYLLTCAYGAIGIFMSSLSTYQIISAIGTFIIIFILSRIGTVWQDIPVVSDITYFLFLAGRTKRMLEGLIASKDVVYFLMVICMFLSFTLIRLRNAREKKPWIIKAMRSVIVMVSVCLIGYICSLPQTTIYIDPTEHQKNTIHEKTQRLLDETGDDELEVTLYTNLLGAEMSYGLPTARNSYLNTMWEKYLRFKPNIKFKYVYYYYYDKSLDGGAYEMNFPGKTNEQIAKEIARLHRVNLKIFKKPEEIKKIVDLDPEGYKLVMQLKYKGRTEFLRTYPSGALFPSGSEVVWPTEMNTAAALMRLIHPETKPRILHITGHYERSIRKIGEREYWYSTMSKFTQTNLTNNGFDFDTIALDKQEIPANTTTLVLADPRSALSDTEQQKIRDYIDKGGNMLIMGEPGKQEILNPVLKQMGVKLMDGTLVQPTFHDMPQMVNPMVTASTAGIGHEPLMSLLKINSTNPYPHDTFKVLMPGVTALLSVDSNGFVRTPLLLTDAENTWLRKGALVTDSAAITYRPEEGDIKDAFVAGIRLSRKVGNKDQRIVIMGDADYISNIRYGGTSIEHFHKTIMHWVSNEIYPVYVPKPPFTDNALTVSGKTMKWLHILYVWGLPALVFVVATVILVRRKRK
ncbi:MAG TPA: Gldg family protein [Pseudobacter sp.]|nr:Gldg family protein [Pseudobacter sp.]